MKNIKRTHGVATIRCALFELERCGTKRVFIAAARKAALEAAMKEPSVEPPISSGSNDYSSVVVVLNMSFDYVVFTCWWVFTD